HFRDIGVHACDESLCGLVRAPRVGRPFARHVAAIEKEPRSAILFDEGWPEAFRKQPKAALAPEIDLPKSIARGLMAFEQERIGARGSEDLRDDPMVDRDVGGFFKTSHRPGLMPDSCGGLRRRSGMRMACREDATESDEQDEFLSAHWPPTCRIA